MEKDGSSKPRRQAFEQMREQRIRESCEKHPLFAPLGPAPWFWATIFPQLGVMRYTICEPEVVQREGCPKAHVDNFQNGLFLDNPSGGTAPRHDYLIH